MSRLSSIRELFAGTVIAAGSPGEVVLCHGTGDSRREMERFRPQVNFAVPSTVNGYWYGWESDASIERSLAAYGVHA